MGTRVLCNQVEADSSTYLPGFSFCKVYGLHVLCHAIFKFFLRQHRERPGEPTSHPSTHHSSSSLLSSNANWLSPQLMHSPGTAETLEQPRWLCLWVPDSPTSPSAQLRKGFGGEKTERSYHPLAEVGGHMVSCQAPGKYWAERKAQRDTAYVFCIIVKETLVPQPHFALKFL